MVLREDKKELRKALLAARDALGPRRRKELSESMQRLLIQSELWKNAGSVALYVSVKSEADTRELTETALKEGKSVFLPRCENRDMVFCRYNGGDGLTASAFGIPEPAEASETLPEDALLIVPCVGLDRYMCRLGMGGGFYDRYFAKRPSGVKLAYLFDCQLVPMIPAESHDAVMDLALTENGFIYPRQNR